MLNQEQLAAWLVERGLAEAEAGFGHASGECVAEALLKSFVITPRH